MSDRFECEPSVLVAGDFNSLPGDKVFSGLHVTFSEFSCFPSLVTLVLVKVPCMVYVNCTYEFSDSLRSSLLQSSIIWEHLPKLKSQVLCKSTKIAIIWA